MRTGAALYRKRLSSRYGQSTVNHNSSRFHGTTTVVGRRSRDIAERFAQRFADFTPAQLAQHAEVTKEAARLWLKAERCINLEDALKLARSLPEGRYWLAQELGEFESPEMIARLLTAAGKSAD